MEKIDSNNNQGNTDNKRKDSDPLDAKKKKTKSDTPNNNPGDKGNEHPKPKQNRIFYILQKPMITNWALVVITLAICVIAYFQCGIAKKSDETSRLRDRAYVYFFTPSFTPYPSEDNPTEWIFKITIHNSGNMPAQSLNIRYAVIDSPTQADIAPIAKAKWTQASTPKTFGPKQDFRFQLFDAEIITVDEFRKMKKSGSIGKFIITEATYFDGFSPRQRVTKMGVRLNLDTTGAHNFSFIQNHNCTDDDCN